MIKGRMEGMCEKGKWNPSGKEVIHRTAAKCTCPSAGTEKPNPGIGTSPSIRLQEVLAFHKTREMQIKSHKKAEKVIVKTTLFSLDLPPSKFYMWR